MRTMAIFGYDFPELSGSSQHILVCQNLLSMMELMTMSGVGREGWVFLGKIISKYDFLPI